MDDPLVKVEGLSKKFCRSLKRSLWYGVQDLGSELLGQRHIHNGELRPDEFWAVKDVSFELKRGECIALIGPNGAGKSTLLKILNGLIKPDKGRIEMKGRIGALIELGAGFNPILTGRENIYINSAVLGFTKKETDCLLPEIIDFANIGDFIDSPVQNYSSGMRVRLGFAVAANLEPNVLLVDEVLAVGDVNFRMKCYDFLLRLMARGTSIIVVSHAVNQLSRITDRAIVMHHGVATLDAGIGASISHYQLLTKPEQKRGFHTGNDSPKIKSICLMNEKGSPKTKFNTGDKLVAEITLKSNIQVNGARLIAAIESPAHGILGSFSTSYSNFSFDVIAPETKVRLEVPELPLLIGGYFLNIHFYGAEITDFYDRWEPGVNFQVIGPPTNAFGFGINHIFKFNSKWL